MIIKKQLLDHEGALRVGRGLGNPKKMIAVHDTGNPSYGANAQAHANLQSRKVLDYGWHWQVDDKEAIQSFKHEYRIYCQGDGYDGIGNNQAISVEICINRDGNYKQAVTNGARLVAKIMKDEGIGIDKVHQHNYFNGKNCPAQIRAGKDGITWKKFKEMVMDFYGEAAKNPTISKTTTAGLYRVTTDVLNIRRGPATSYFITGQIRDRGIYTIVEIKNGWGKLKSGAGWIHLSYAEKVGKTATPKKSINTIAKEVIQGKWGNGSDRKNRLKKAGYDPVKVQAEVNRMVTAGEDANKSPKKSIKQIAKEVIAGDWGNGEERKKKLKAAGYDYNQVQAEVNKLV